MVKVKQFRSPTSGRDIPNQFVITEKTNYGHRKYFQSYSSIIGYIDVDDTGSYTTTRNKIKSGEYRLADLNNTYN